MKYINAVNEAGKSLPSALASLIVEGREEPEPAPEPVPVKKVFYRGDFYRFPTAAWREALQRFARAFAGRTRHFERGFREAGERLRDTFRP